MSSMQMLISPTNLTKLGAADAARLHEYITALEKQNKSRNDERIFMEKYIEGLRKDVEDYTRQSKQWKDKRIFFDSEIFRLSHQNMRIIDEIRQREDFIRQLQQEIERINVVYRQNEFQKQQLLKQRHQQILLIEQKNQALTQLSIASSKEREILNNNNQTLARKLNQTEILFKQSENTRKQLQKDKKRLAQQLKFLNAEVERKQRLDQVRTLEYRNEISKLKEDSQKFEEEVKDLRQKLSVQTDRNKELEESITSTQLKHQTQSQQWQNKQKQIQQFINYVKTSMNQMQNTIESQNLQIHALTTTNQTLKQQILESIIKMSQEIQQKKYRELTDLKLQLASYKGKLAEKERKFIMSQSKLLLTPLDRDLFRFRGAETTQEEKQSQTLEERDKNIIIEPEKGEDTNGSSIKRSGLHKSKTLLH